MKAYLILLLAIVLETIATSFLKQSEQFTRLLPTIITVAGYAGSFYCLSLVLKNIPVGIAYAIWSGMGIVLISAIGWVAFKQHLDLAAISGLALIIAGVLVINIFSNSGFPLMGKKRKSIPCKGWTALPSGQRQPE